MSTCKTVPLSVRVKKSTRDFILSTGGASLLRSIVENMEDNPDLSYTLQGQVTYLISQNKILKNRLAQICRSLRTLLEDEVTSHGE